MYTAGIVHCSYDYYLKGFVSTQAVEVSESESYVDNLEIETDTGYNAEDDDADGECEVCSTRTYIHVCTVFVFACNCVHIVE